MNDIIACRLKIRGFEEVKKDTMRFKNLTFLPIRGDDRAAGYDMYSKEDFTLLPGQKHIFWTDIKAYMLPDEVLEIHVRSSIGIKKGLVLANTTGIIDSSYYENESNDGNIGICLKNASDEPVKIECCERIAQGIFQKYLKSDEDSFLGTKRTGGIGSTGTK